MTLGMQPAHTTGGTWRGARRYGAASSDSTGGTIALHPARAPRAGHRGARRALCRRGSDAAALGEVDRAGPRRLHRRRRRSRSRSRLRRAAGVFALARRDRIARGGARGARRRDRCGRGARARRAGEAPWHPGALRAHARAGVLRGPGLRRRGPSPIPGEDAARLPRVRAPRRAHARSAFVGVCRRRRTPSSSRCRRGRRALDTFEAPCYPRKTIDCPW
jgi:hypothetical protein